MSNVAFKLLERRLFEDLCLINDIKMVNEWKF